VIAASQPDRGDKSIFKGAHIVDSNEMARWIAQNTTTTFNTPRVFVVGETGAFRPNNFPTVNANHGSTLRETSRDTRKSPDKTKKDLKWKLGRVCDAFDQFQSDRNRDAIYGYVAPVFELVTAYKGKRRTRQLMRCAYSFAGLPCDKHADPFAAIIRCTSGGETNNKTISKWSRALRYVAECKRPMVPLRRFMKEMGGVNACADRFAEYFGRHNRTGSHCSGR